MTLYDFNRGSQEERLAWTWQHGAYLSYRFHLGHRIALYHLSEFFIEVYYQVQGNEVDYVRGFQSLELLAPYLAKIKLPDVIR
ncbi:hypothetical protein [Adhaeribacter pallidiroseus]|uniref:Uncharacterized protein n=1 Tax=Adhaeribacter pallidiroseus TaxID=2072847 RepID=A0A369Q5B8_9BACT|nr:hypothetical protein [Adhaeribacter pallidiroseus]RDC58695.1 hypothetical protein AHMF7616_05329 [Adhaeribacter pallidiroseus]